MQDRRKIALVIDSMYGGGAEKAVLTLRRELARLGHIAHVIALQSVGHYDISAEANVHFLAGKPKYPGGTHAYRRQARELRALLDALERADGLSFDLVIANLINSHRVVAAAQLPHVWYCVHAPIEETLTQLRRHNRLQYWRQRWLHRVLIGKRVVAVSKGLAQEIRASAWLQPATVRAIYNPVELQVCRARAMEPAAGLPERPYLLHVGRACREKRLDVLFQSLQYVPGDAPLLMLTNHPDKVRRLAADHGVTDRVTAIGFQQNPYPWIANAQLLIMSSDYEGLSMAIIEALACGTPVVSTDCPHGPSELLAGPLARWLVPVGDARALGARICEALTAKIDVSCAPILEHVDAAVIAAEYAALPA
jgi:glycosyltransferase involved in cell wall biosynthesis